MSATLILSLLLIGIIGKVISHFAPHSRGAIEVRSVTGENFAVLLAGAEAGQLVIASAKIDAKAGMPQLTMPTALIVLGLIVAANLSRVMLVIISIAGLAAGVLEVAISDGPSMAAVLVVMIALLWTISMLVRMLRPLRR